MPPDESNPIIHNVPNAAIELHEFTCITKQELAPLLCRLVGKSCILDPIPGCILRDCIEELLPIVTRIINLSLQTAVMPNDIKEAVLKPKIKKASLDNELFPSFRPFSNIRFLAKATEKVVASKLDCHLTNSNAHELYQLAYKQGHSAETALVRVQNDILCGIDDGGYVVLLLLDLSAAFDTVDHTILLTCLSTVFGIKVKALAWFRSHLSERTQFVQIDNDFSHHHKLSCGVPQGSVHGPILYLLYTAPLADVIRHREMCYHFYADDGQIYMTFKPLINETAEDPKSAIEACARDINYWMNSNKLKLNNDKTELLVIQAPHRPLPPLQCIYSGAEQIESARSAKEHWCVV
jgi:hypothetical protein